MDNVGGVRGIFGCDSEILFFIILFLLLFCDDRRGRRYC
jgi:hypothetical protein